MNILITGGAGFIGSAVIVKRLVRGLGCKRRFLNLFCKSEKCRICIQYPNYSFEQVDIRERGNLT